MDPVTQGALGAAAAQLAVGRRLGPRTWLYGCLGGMAADLDVLIRSSTDPLLGIIYHRHFTHSLAFIPVGGLLVALPWILRDKYKEQRKLILVATTVGYATHALLDCCTSYGTMYLWPFSDQRVAWSFISIVDLVYTVPLLLGVWLTKRSGSMRPVTIAFVFAHIYMALCGLQKLRALDLRDRLAESRGHVVERSFVQNLIATNIGWRSIYEYDGRIYADALYTPWFGEPVVEEGESVDVATADDLPAPVRQNERTSAGFETFSWFASGWVVAETSQNGEALVCDVRYSRVPARFSAFWCARLRPGDDTPVARVDNSDKTKMDRFLEASFFAPATAHPVQ